MMQVNIEDILRIKKERSQINKLDFMTIEWYKDGKKLEIPDKDKEEFMYTGLSNFDFIDDDGSPIKMEERDVNNEIY